MAQLVVELLAVIDSEMPLTLSSVSLALRFMAWSWHGISSSSLFAHRLINRACMH